jgi:membrane-bound hydrogenase subunit mbhJ
VNIRAAKRLGDCACDCGMFKGSYGVTGPVERHVQVDVKIHGFPPRPAEILNALQHLRKRSD